MAAYPRIVSATGFVSQDVPGKIEFRILYENKETLGHTSGLTMWRSFKYEGAMCYYDPGVEYHLCADVTRWNLKDNMFLITTDLLGIFNSGCVEANYCTDSGARYSQPAGYGYGG